MRRVVVLLIGLLLTGAALADQPDGTYICKLDGADETRIAGPTTPAWLPDGKSLLLATNNALYRCNVDGSGKIQLWEDSRLAKILNLTVAPSGRFAAGVVINRLDGSGAVRVWALPDARQVMEDRLYTTASLDGGEHYLNALLAWSPKADLLAWAPLEYEGVSKRARAVKVFDGEVVRWNTWYLDQPLWSLCWHADRPALIVTTGESPRAGVNGETHPAVSLLELSNGGRSKRLLARELADGGAGDSVMTWLPRIGAFCWGQTFYAADGTLLKPLLPEVDGPVARLCWASSTGLDVVLATSFITDTGDCAADGMQGLSGAEWYTFRRLLRLPTVPRQIYFSGDGSRICYVIGGYIPD